MSMTPEQHRQWVGRFSPEKRLAILLRDGLACVYCGSSLEESALLTLDRVAQHPKGPKSHPSNLITCCTRCRKARGDRCIEDFAAAVAGFMYRGVTGAMILDGIAELMGRDIRPYLENAKAIMARRQGEQR